ncbi:MAG: choline kinase, partial [Mariprofundaceae bacterium]|nr:choline kinase [Mariprofundaceae bacterium]
WHSNISHARKLKSYRIEVHWYEQWSQYCDALCRVPKSFLTTQHDNELIMLLEDMNASGFSIRRERAM